MDPEKDKEGKDEDLVVGEKKVGEEDNVVEENKVPGGAEVAAPTRSRRKRRRKKRVVENDPGAACAPRVPHHIPNGRPAGESDIDPEDDDIHPFTCSCPECQQWRQPPSKDNDDPEKWFEDQQDKSTL